MSLLRAIDARGRGPERLATKCLQSSNYSIATSYFALPRNEPNEVGGGPSGTNRTSPAARPRNEPKGEVACRRHSPQRTEPAPVRPRRSAEPETNRTGPRDSFRSSLRAGSSRIRGEPREVASEGWLPSIVPTVRGRS